MLGSLEALVKNRLIPRFPGLTLREVPPPHPKSGEHPWVAAFLTALAREVLIIGAVALAFWGAVRLSPPTGRTKVYFAMERGWRAHWPMDRGKQLLLLVRPVFEPFVPVREALPQAIPATSIPHSEHRASIVVIDLPEGRIPPQ